MRIINLSKLIDIEIILEEDIPADKLYIKLLQDDIAAKYCYLDKLNKPSMELGELLNWEDGFRAYMENNNVRVIVG